MTSGVFQFATAIVLTRVALSLLSKQCDDEFPGFQNGVSTEVCFHFKLFCSVTRIWELMPKVATKILIFLLIPPLINKMISCYNPL